MQNREAYSERVTFRVTPAMHRELEKHAQGKNLSVSSYARFVLLTKIGFDASKLPPSDYNYRDKK